ncbi:unnamed protein product [Candida verbasci]|uniref:C2 NT-type domain-containing protein n=1 Tax=Candida verbasci TaxID=1227364 RepID=A0A9W4XFA9_9ASCO|nr:unnamed protein product [Candida verbasci]
MFKSDKPKFSFQLTINDLTNVPQIHGSCFIELQIKDGKRRNLHHSHTAKDLENNNGNQKVNKSFLNKFDDTLTSLALGKDSNKHNTSISQTSSNSKDVKNNSVVTGNISATTSLKKLHNFKCNFNYQLSCNLKFGIQKKKNLISNKYLLIKVYYVTTDSSEHHHLSNIGSKHTIELGKVDVNLSEYLNFDEPVTTKYLLSDSKVNSILSLTIGINELPSNFDFHTQLQITDNNSSTSSTATNTKTNLDLRNSQNHKKNTFNVPQFEQKLVFNGINNVFGENGTFNGNPSQPTLPPQYKDQKTENNNNNNNSNNNNNNNNNELSSQSSQGSETTTHHENSFLQQLAPHHNGSRFKKEKSSSNSPPPGQKKAPDDAKQQQILMDPIVSELYCRILECNWDPDLYPLLEYSPNQCINDIFNNENNKYGCNLDLKNYYEEKLKPELLVENENYRKLNGLINEYKYRSDLKSWKIGET